MIETIGVVIYRGKHAIGEFISNWYLWRILIEMYSGTRLFSDIARERYAEMGYLWRIADIFFFFALKWRPLCKALYENALIYFQSPAAPIHTDAADQACVAPRHVWLYSGFPALITRLQRSLQRFPRINVRPSFVRHRVATYVLAKPKSCLFLTKNIISKTKNWFPVVHN